MVPVVRARGASPPGPRCIQGAGQGRGLPMARKKQEAASGAESAAMFAGPLGTYVYFILAANGAVIANHGAGTSTPDSLLGAGWTALRETALSGGGALVVLKR